MNVKNLPFFSLFSVSIEYFDFILFPIFAKTLIEIFFNNQFDSSLVNFLFFSSGPIIRIASSFLLGIWAAKFGNASLIKLTTFAMLFATITFGLMPLYFSPLFYLILFAILRTIQGFAFSIEMPATTSYAYDHNPKTQANIAKTILSASLGYVLVLFTLFLLNNSLSENQIKEWGWRIPFAISIIIAFFAFKARSRLQNIQHIVIEKNEKKPNYMHILSLMLFPVALIDVNLYFPMYLNLYWKLSTNLIYEYQLISIIFSMLISFIFTRIEITKIKQTYILCILGFLSIFPFFDIFLKNNILLLAFFIIWQFFITTSIILGLFLVLQKLKIAKKIMIYALLYNIAFLMTSFIPITFTKLIAWWPNYMILFYMIAIFAIISLISAILYQEKD